MGVTGMIRFLQQNETGHGDYTKERHEYLGDPSMEQLVADIQSSDCNKKEVKKNKGNVKYHIYDLFLQLS